jgi:hypothetical protein
MTLSNGPRANQWKRTHDDGEVFESMVYLLLANIPPLLQRGHLQSHDGSFDILDSFHIVSGVQTCASGGGNCCRGDGCPASP